MAWQFDRCGDHLALDFANTLSDRGSAAPVERLVEYEDLVAFAEQCALVTAARAGRLRGEGRRRPDEARAVLRRARILREGLYGLFVASARHEAPAGEHLAALNAELPRLQVGPDFALAWRETAEELDGFLGAVVSAAFLLVTDREARARIDLCQAPDCDWLFYDTSKNRSRRWCDMRQCGNRMKARRHQARGRGGAKSAR